MIKTRLENTLFMYQPGMYGQYLAGLLKDGKLNVRFNFGYGNELIEVDEGELTISFSLRLLADNII